RTELDLDEPLVPLDNDVDGAISVVLGSRVSPLDVLADSPNLPAWLRAELFHDPVDSPLRIHDDAHAADVLHRREGHPRKAVQFVDDRLESLQALRDVLL